MIDLIQLPRSHAERLRWFELREGTTTGWPGKDERGRHLVTKAKGIYKPEDLVYALSVRVMLSSPYPDGEVQWHEGGWTLRYHQENDDPADRDLDYTNVALMRNKVDGVPVAVIRQVPPDRKPRMYQVLGLAQVVEWENGFFLLRGTAYHPDAR